MKPKEGIRNRKIRRVTEYLKDLLCRYPYGERLPGIRTLMKKTGCGRIIVCRALEQLKEEDLLRIDPRRGIFRNDPGASDKEIRLLNWQIIDADGTNLFFRHLYDRLFELAASSGRKITLENAIGRQPEELTEELVSSGITRCIVGSAPNPDAASSLKKRMKVCMELLPQHSGRVTTELRDSPDMTVQQLSYLFNLGYRRIAYMHFGEKDMSRYPIHIMRLLDYYRMMAIKGYQVNPDWVFCISDDCGNIENGIIRILNSNPKPEALIVPSEIFSSLYSYCRKLNIRIGKDVAVFACEDVLEPQFPNVTVITNNPKEIAEKFWKMFLAEERGEGTGSHNTKLLIRIGQTVPHLKSTAAKSQ